MHKISPFVDRVIPEFIRTDYPQFITFLEKYFVYLERIEGVKSYTLVQTLAGTYDSTNIWAGDYLEVSPASSIELKKLIGSTITGASSSATAKVRNVYTLTINSVETPVLKVIKTANFTDGEELTYSELGEYTQVANIFLYGDIDETIDQFFLDHRTDWAIDIPESIFGSVRLLIKKVRDYYASKGSEKSFEYLFKLLYNVPVEFYYPKVHVLRASDGNWTIPTYILLDNRTPADTPIWVNKFIKGLTSLSTAKIQSFNNITHPKLSSTIELFANLINVNGTFIPGETIELLDDATTTNTIATGTDTVRIEQGYYSTEYSLISDRSRLQDNNYYQDFSYVLQSSIPVGDFESTITELVHPAGLRLFGELAFLDSFAYSSMDAFLEITPAVSYYINEYPDLVINSLYTPPVAPYTFPLDITSSTEQSSGLNQLYKYNISTNTWAYVELHRENITAILFAKDLFESSITIGDFNTKATEQYPYLSTV